MMFRLVAVTAAILMFPPTVLAWKVPTHIALARIALEDAQDGTLDIPLLNPPGSVPVKLDEGTVKDLTQFPGQYLAGVVGPDGYPDMLTGQQVIHPDEAESGVPGGSDAWLCHIWTTFDQSSAERAFRLGFMTHAAGDIFAHTFVNHFADGPFTLDPLKNAQIHIILEGYVDKKLGAKASASDISIDGVSDRIFNEMVFARKGSDLDRLLPSQSSSTNLSVPRLFSTLRQNLEDYAAGINTGDCCDSNYLLRAASMVYAEEWRKDVETGLMEWPNVSHAVAGKLFLESDIDATKKILSAYKTTHLLSMLGMPDFLVKISKKMSDIMRGLMPQKLIDAYQRIMDDILDSLLKATTGMSAGDFTDLLANPETHFETIPIKRDEFDRNYLHLAADGTMDWQKVPALYNSVLLSKLVLLRPDQIDAVVKKLGGKETLAQPNVMLGFVPSLDGTQQWRAGTKLVFARECAVYNRLFKPLDVNQGGCAD